LAFKILSSPQITGTEYKMFKKVLGHELNNPLTADERKKGSDKHAELLKKQHIALLQLNCIKKEIAKINLTRCTNCSDLQALILKKTPIKEIECLYDRFNNWLEIKVLNSDSIYIKSLLEREAAVLEMSSILSDPTSKESNTIVNFTYPSNCYYLLTKRLIALTPELTLLLNSGKLNVDLIDAETKAKEQDNGESYHHLAQCYWRAEHFTKAKENFNKAIEKGYKESVNTLRILEEELADASAQAASLSSSTQKTRFLLQ
jgi:hypothetical protein